MTIDEEFRSLDMSDDAFRHPESVSDEKLAELFGLEKPKAFSKAFKEGMKGKMLELGREILQLQDTIGDLRKDIDRLGGGFEEDYNDQFETIALTTFRKGEGSKKFWLEGKDPALDECYADFEKMEMKANALEVKNKDMQDEVAKFKEQRNKNKRRCDIAERALSQLRKGQRWKVSLIDKEDGTRKLLRIPFSIRPSDKPDSPVIAKIDYFDNRVVLKKTSKTKYYPHHLRWNNYDVGRTKNAHLDMEENTQLILDGRYDISVVDVSQEQGT